MPDSCWLIGDIGGTHARFAIAAETAPGFSAASTLQCADFGSPEAAIKHYLDTVGGRAPDAICLAAAGPIVDGRVRFTNNPWSISVDELADDFSIDSIRLLNDFEAVGYSIPFLASDECLPIGLPDPHRLDESGYTIGIIGPGTGLGKVGVVKRGGQLITLSGEAGHTGFAPETQVQLDILTILRERFDRVSTERVVSGPGLENIFWALARLRADNAEQLDAANIFAHGEENSESIAHEAVQVFFEVLGQVAGDLAMSLGAIDGIYIAGGIAQRYPKLLMNSKFRSGFENKGPHREIMERIPTQLIMHPQPGLLGASYVVQEMSSRISRD
jgi:glucokinase